MDKRLEKKFEKLFDTLDLAVALLSEIEDITAAQFEEEDK